MEYLSPTNRVRNTTFVIFDLETTGLKEDRDRVLEIGAVRVTGDRITARSTWLVNPHIPIPEGVQRIHGITPEMVKDAPSFSQVYPRFMHFIGDSILMSHNARFDISFLAAEIHRCNLPVPDLAVLDTLRLFQHAFPKRRSYSLKNLTLDLCPNLSGQTNAAMPSDIPREQRFHSAGWDAECTAELLILALGRIQDDTTVELFEKYCRGRIPLTRPARPDRPPGLPQTGKSLDAPAR